ncbi:MAG: ribosome maturation factor RimP [Alphaproteobacteria bacterium]|jgi:ribosome maturation factor RimP|nr:ribosome maturation factor RimP [Alphaproteobacteria bacterium]
MNLEERIEDIITPTLEDMGFSPVRILKTGKALQIMVEKENGDAVSLDECSKISNALSAVLDVEDIIQDKYMLEISSAGMDRPLVKLKDYNKFLGNLVKVEAKFPLEDFGYKKFKGFIKSVNDNLITFENSSNNDLVEIELDDINKCNLEITDDMIKNLLRK